MGIIIRKGTQEDVDALAALLWSVRESMEHKDWFFLDTPEEIRSFMDEGIMEMWIAEDEGEIVAAFDMLRPGLRSFNYGYDLNLREEELLRVINLNSAAVAPTHRGLGLQRKLIQCAEEQLRDEGPYILMCTVHPQNRFSLDNVLRQGYTVVKEYSKYGSVRYLLQKKLF